jgi:hypothetical protein
VKCDEVYPVCRRCVSTGRTCDGYGVWGGGESSSVYTYGPTVSRNSTFFPRSSYISFLVISNEENELFDWFKSRTVGKLPGSFISDFWTTLLLQATLSEPAVLHAVLAMTSVHKGGVINADHQQSRNSVPDKLEQVTLQHYLKAISHLQPHFLAKDRASIRIALITCIAFISLDFLRGYFATAQIHLQNGLKLLGDTQTLSESNDELLLLKPGPDSIDDWIGETFSRLYTQVELYKQLYAHQSFLLQVTGPRLPTPTFRSFKEAWHEIDRLLNHIFHMTRQARKNDADGMSPYRPPALLEQQQRVRTELALWHDTYEASRKTLQDIKFHFGKKAYLLLSIYHTMVTIMSETCLYPSNEGMFDSHTNQFVHLMAQLIEMQTLSSNIFRCNASPKQRPFTNMASSIVDIGWIPPLYYAAVKCRIHRIRLQAIRFLESSFHREGIWDATIAARVSRKVMELEERDFYKDMEATDDFLLSSYPQPSDLSLSTLPESYRIRDVEVILSGEPVDTILLFCKQRRDGKDHKVRRGRYDVSLQHWIDIDE